MSILPNNSANHIARHWQPTSVPMGSTPMDQIIPWTYLVVQWQDSMLPMQQVWVWSWLGEQGSHMRGVWPKNIQNVPESSRKHNSEFAPCIYIVLGIITRNSICRRGDVWVILKYHFIFYRRDLNIHDFGFNGGPRTKPFMDVRDHCILFSVFKMWSTTL